MKFVFFENFFDECSDLKMDVSEVIDFVIVGLFIILNCIIWWRFEVCFVNLGVGEGWLNLVGL